MTLVKPRHAGGPRIRAEKPPSPAMNRTNAAWLRDQNESLRMRITFGPGILSMADVVRAIAAINAGLDFRNSL